jgi:hypothetical protein
MTTTNKYKVGDSVIANGYPGTVTAVTANGMIEVRLASGGVCLDPNDALSVQPGSIWTELCKMAESDLRAARKLGSILICQTRRGTVELAYYANAKRFEAHTMGPDSRFVASGTAKEMVERIASLYQIVAG